MSSILIYSKSDEGNPIAFTLKREGHIVRVCSTNPDIFATSANPSALQNPNKMLEQFDLIISMFPEPIPSHKVIGAGNFHEKILSEGMLHDIRTFILPHTSQVPRTALSCSLSVWMTPNGFLPFHFIILSYGRLCNGERGPSFHSGAVHIMRVESKLFTDFAQPLLSLLQKVKFFGPLTLSLSLSTDGAYLRSITPYPIHLQGMCELLHQPLFKLLWSSYSGEDLRGQSDEYALTNRLHCFSPERGVEYINPQPQALPHVWMRDAQEGDPWTALGTSGILAEVSARGVSIKECQRRVRRTISNCVRNPEVMYRDDIGDDAEERIGWLKEAGWLT